MALSDIPVLVEFVPGTSLYRERVSQFPILRKGPAGTFVVLPEGLRVSLPTDQLVYADDTGGCARVGFGGMDFRGCDDGRLAFVRVRELHPEERLSPDRSHRMLLEQSWVSSVLAHGYLVWQAAFPCSPS